MSGTRAAAAVLAAGFLAAGCGGGNESSTSATTPAPPPGGSARDTEVIREWSETLSRGRVDEAARSFSTPAVVENGTGPIEVTNSQGVRAFNESLPCGARLLRTTGRGRYTVATFKLLDRPGGDCGTGTGGQAATAFLIQDGKIVEWRRVAVPPPPPKKPAPKPPEV